MNDKELAELLGTARKQLTDSLRTTSPMAGMAYALASIAASQFVIAERTVNETRTKPSAIPKAPRMKKI